MAIIRFFHLLSLVVWLGGMIFFSFIAAPSIFKVLPRETAGDVVGDIFPKYWVMGYVCGITAIITAILLSVQGKAYPWTMIILLFVMSGLTFYSGLVVGLKARDVKAQIRTIEDPSQKEALRLQFKALHKRSTIMNGLILILGLIVIFFTSYQLKN